MIRTLSLFLLLLLLLPFPAMARGEATLQGSPASMHRQNGVATTAGYTFVETPEEMRRLVARGELVRLRGNADYTFRSGMSGGVARPEMRLFIERLAAQYHAATGEQLVVTSLTRPSSRQPKNAHALSVHPAGIAVDLRVSPQARSRQWLESVLLSLERSGVLDVTRERWPPHYHVALFPEAYLAHVEKLIGVEALAAALAGTALEEEFKTRAEALRAEAIKEADVNVEQEVAEQTPAAAQEAAVVAVPSERAGRGYLLPIVLLMALSLGAFHLRRVQNRAR